MKNFDDEQIRLCQKYQADYWALDLDSNLGVSMNLFSGELPINGLRHRPEGDSNGWYLWAGDVLPSDADFFQPFHARHLIEKSPRLLRYLGLPPGWRFLIAREYEDVWNDETLTAESA
jgi:hypothetical protein